MQKRKWIQEAVIIGVIMGLGGQAIAQTVDMPRNVLVEQHSKEEIGQVNQLEVSQEQGRVDNSTVAEEDEIERSEGEESEEEENLGNSELEEPSQEEIGDSVTEELNGEVGGAEKEPGAESAEGSEGEGSEAENKVEGGEVEESETEDEIEGSEMEESEVEGEEEGNETEESEVEKLQAAPMSEPGIVYLTERLLVREMNTAAYTLEMQEDVVDNKVVIVGEEGTSYQGVSIIIPVGTEVTLQNVTIDNTDYNQLTPIVFQGEGNTLMIVGENTCIGGGWVPGVHVPPGADVRITGGSADGIVVVGGRHGAAIGGRRNQDAGSIYIEGGQISAIATGGGAGIGGGYYGSVANICISGGEISCSSEKGAGIGAGEGSGHGVIEITGGVVDVSSKNGAAIGAGVLSTNNADITITIDGGEITASSEENVVIGSWAPAKGEREGQITIRSGKLELVGKKASAPIIGHASEKGERNLGRVMLDNGPSLDLQVFVAYDWWQSKWKDATLEKLGYYVPVGLDVILAEAPRSSHLTVKLLEEESKSPSRVVQIPTAYAYWLMAWEGDAYPYIGYEKVTEEGKKVEVVYGYHAAVEDGMPGAYVKLSETEVGGEEGKPGEGAGSEGEESKPGEGAGSEGEESKPGEGGGSEGEESKPGEGEEGKPGEGEEGKPGEGMGSEGDESKPGNGQGTGGSVSDSGETGEERVTATVVLEKQSQSEKTLKQFLWQWMLTVTRRLLIPSNSYKLQ